MKLKKSYIAHNTETESLLVPAGGAGFSGLVRGNKTLGAILECLQRDTTEPEIVAALVRRFDGPEKIIAEDVNKALESLRSIDALDE